MTIQRTDQIAFNFKTLFVAILNNVFKIGDGSRRIEKMNMIQRLQKIADFGIAIFIKVQAVFLRIVSERIRNLFGKIDRSLHEKTFFTGILIISIGH